MDLYEVRIRVPLERITAVIQAGGLGATIVAILPPTPLTRVAHHKRVNTHRYNGAQSGYELAKAFLTRRATFTHTELEAAFAAKGRNPKSASPILSRLKAEGKVKTTTSGYRRAK